MFLPLPVIANKSIHFKIYNLNKFLSNLDIDRFIKDNTILLFNCKGSKFIDQLQKHLTILTYNRLKNVFTRDPKFSRKENNFLYDKNIEQYINERKFGSLKVNLCCVNKYSV